MNSTRSRAGLRTYNRQMDQDSGSQTHGKPGGSTGEFELIGALKSVIEGKDGPTDLVVGIGDDAAAIEVTPGIRVMTTDTMVDGVHFKRDLANWGDVGWKSAVSNLSDVAAMGAVPLHSLVTIGVPHDVSTTEMEEMYRGLVDAFSEFGGHIVGGDVVSSPVFFVTVALTGLASVIDDGPAILRRDTAEPGDLIGVTGSLGGSAGGLRAVLQNLTGTAVEDLKRFHYRPVPRLKEGKVLLESGIKCAMDISDGLVGDLEKICAASEVGAVVNSGSIPTPDSLTSVFSEDALQMALSGGEDYELLFTAPFDLMDRLLASQRGFFTHIGSIIEAPEDGDAVTVRESNGQIVNLEKRGWDHLGTG